MNPGTGFLIGIGLIAVAVIIGSLVLFGIPAFMLWVTRKNISNSQIKNCLLWAAGFIGGVIFAWALNRIFGPGTSWIGIALVLVVVLVRTTRIDKWAKIAIMIVFLVIATIFNPDRTFVSFCVGMLTFGLIAFGD